MLPIKLSCHILVGNNCLRCVLYNTTSMFSDEPLCKSKQNIWTPLETFMKGVTPLVRIVALQWLTKMLILVICFFVCFLREADSFPITEAERLETKVFVRITACKDIKKALWWTGQQGCGEANKNKMCPRAHTHTHPYTLCGQCTHTHRGEPPPPNVRPMTSHWASHPAWWAFVLCVCSRVAGWSLAPANGMKTRVVM